MLAERVATPVLERLARGEAKGVVRGASGGAAYLDFDGFVVALTGHGVPLMPNGIALARVDVSHGPARGAPGLIEADGAAIVWDPAAPPAWEPALPRARPDARGALAVRGALILAALGVDGAPSIAGGMAVTATGRGAEGAQHLRRALAERDPDAAALAA